MEGILLPPLVLPQVHNLLEWEDPSRDGFRVIGDCLVVLHNPVEVWSVVGSLSSLKLDGRCGNDERDKECIIPGSDYTKELKSVKENQWLRRTVLTTSALNALVKALYFSFHSLGLLSIALIILFPVTFKNSAGLVLESSGMVGIT